MRTRQDNTRMALLGTALCAGLMAALWWATPPSPIGCDHHRDCPPTAGRCLVHPAISQGLCSARCATDADCADGCCRPTAIDETLACAPAAACGP